MRSSLGTRRGWTSATATTIPITSPLPYAILPRRAGDIASCYASSEKAERELGWKAEYGIEEMCRDQWNWQKNNPEGYQV